MFFEKFEEIYDFSNTENPKKLNEIPLSVLDTVPVLEGQTVKVAFDNMISLAKHAEKLGYNRYWLAEHHNMPGIASSATSVAIGYVAANTEKIRVGSGGVMLPNHSPLVIAEQFGSLDAMYPNRIDLGLGRAPGSDQNTAFALRGDTRNHGQNFPIQLEELRRYFDGTSLNNVRATPGEGSNLPIWLLGSSDFSARLAAKLGLPFSFASHFSDDNTIYALRAYRDNFMPSKDLDKPYVILGLNVFAADTTEEAYRLSTSHQQSFLDLMRNKPGKLKPPVDTMDGIWTAHEEAVLKRQLKSTIIGNPEEVKVQLQEFISRTQADELIITSAIYDQKARLRSYEILAEIAELNKI